jgi:hypothetical protein
MRHNQHYETVQKTITYRSISIQVGMTSSETKSIWSMFPLNQHQITANALRIAQQAEVKEETTATVTVKKASH